MSGKPTTLPESESELTILGSRSVIIAIEPPGITVSTGFPPVIIRDKEKADYYKSFKEYRYKEKSEGLEKVMILALCESFQKRITYLKGQKIIKLTEYAKIINLTSQNVLNKALRQTIPAFREKGVWKIGVDIK